MTIHFDELLSLCPADPCELKCHGDAFEARGISGGPHPLDSDVHTLHRNTLLLCITLDQGDTARRDAGEKRLGVGEGVVARVGG